MKSIEIIDTRLKLKLAVNVSHNNCIVYLLIYLCVCHALPWTIRNRCQSSSNCPLNLLDYFLQLPTHMWAYSLAR